MNIRSEKTVESEAIPTRLKDLYGRYVHTPFDLGLSRKGVVAVTAMTSAIVIGAVYIASNIAYSKTREETFDKGYDIGYTRGYHDGVFNREPLPAGATSQDGIVAENSQGIDLQELNEQAAKMNKGMQVKVLAIIPGSESSSD